MYKRKIESPIWCLNKHMGKIVNVLFMGQEQTYRKSCVIYLTWCSIKRKRWMVASVVLFKNHRIHIHFYGVHIQRRQNRFICILNEKHLKNHGHGVDYEQFLCTVCGIGKVVMVNGFCPFSSTTPNTSWINIESCFLGYSVWFPSHNLYLFYLFICNKTLKMVHNIHHHHPPNHPSPFVYA